MKKLLIFIFVLVPCVVGAESADSIAYVGAVKMPHYAWGVFVQDTITYVADRGALVTVNVSIPQSPWIAGSTNSGSSATQAIGVIGQDSLAYVNTGGSKFGIINVSNPYTPYLLGWCYIPELQEVEPKGIIVVDTLVYLADAAEGIVIISVAIPDSPFVIETYNTPRWAIDLFIQNNTK